MSYAFRRNIEAIKEAVSIEDVAAEYTALGPIGSGQFIGRCPFPDHEDSTPSFHVYAEEGRFKCFGIGCQRAGDVLDLEKLAGRHAETWTAMVALSVRYGVELPGRSRRWHEAQDRKTEYLDAAYAVIGDVMCRRLYKTLVLPYVDALIDPEERERELERSWQDWQRRLFWPSLAEKILSGQEDTIRALAVVYIEAGGAG